MRAVIWRAGVWATVVIAALLLFMFLSDRHRHEVSSGQTDEASDSHAQDPDPGLAALRRMRAAENIDDPHRRCREYPIPAGIEWPQPPIDAFCADEFTPILSLQQASNWILTDETPVLEDRLDTSLDGYYRGALAEWALYRQYQPFADSSVRIGRLTERWLRHAPESAHARLARGLHLYRSGTEARGTELVRNTPAADLKRMRVLLKQSIDLLESALDIEPRLLPALHCLIDIGKFLGDRSLIEDAFERGLIQDPASFYLRSRHLFAHQPEWGGSLERIDELAQQGQEHLDSNPRLANLTTLALTERVKWMFRNKVDTDSAAMLELAMRANAAGSAWFALEWGTHYAHRTGDRVLRVQLLSQMLRFTPNASKQRLQRARSLVRLGEIDWARDDLRLVLTQEPDNLVALREHAWLDIQSGDSERALDLVERLYALDPDDLWALDQMAWVHLRLRRDLVAAEPLIDRLLERRPDNGRAWALRLELLKVGGRPGVGDAVRRFIETADESRPDQRRALAEAHAWLAENPEEAARPIAPETE